MYFAILVNKERPVSFMRRIYKLNYSLCRFNGTWLCPPLDDVTVYIYIYIYIYTRRRIRIILIIC